MAYDELIPGLTAFMEDEDAGADDENEAVAEAEEKAADAEAEKETAEEETEAVKDESNAEAATAMFERLAIMEEHIKRYGVDRTFLNLCNYDNVLGNGLGIHLPAAESFDAVGNPRSSESIACLEGIGEYWNKLKDFVKKLWEKFKNWLDRVMASISSWFNNVEVSASRLRTLISEAKAKNGAIDEKQKSKASKEVIDPAYLGDFHKKLAGFIGTEKTVQFSSTNDMMATDKGTSKLESEILRIQTTLKQARAKLTARSIKLEKVTLDQCEKMVQMLFDLKKVSVSLNQAMKYISGDGEKKIKDLILDLEENKDKNTEKIKKVKQTSKEMSMLRTHFSKILTYVTYEQSQIKKIVSERCRLTLGGEMKLERTKKEK